MTETALLEMNHITKRFPGVVALHDVTFAVMPQTIHGLVGENGAGKSTLMKILSGTYPSGSYDGEVRLNGKALVLKAGSDALEQGIGIVPQEISVLDQLTVAENIVVGQWGVQNRQIVDWQAVNRTVRAFLDEYSINLRPSVLVSRLTAAEKQLVMIARALYRKPSVLILDEPTSSLALNEVEHLFEKLNMLRQKGTTCVFITHKLAEIFELTDRTTVLRDGEVVGQFERAKYDQMSIITAMVGRKIENLYPARTSEIGIDEVLRVEHLTVPHPTIANRNIIEDVNFVLKKGEILGIAGLVGSGRSETVNAIIGRLVCHGKIVVNGREVTIASPADAKRLGIALVTEDRKKDGLLARLEIRPNTTLHSLVRITNFGMLNAAYERRLATDAMSKFNIKAPSIEQLVGNLSGGNQQKVILAKVLMDEPQILFLDEPTKGIDIGAKHEIYKLMLDLVEQGISIVMISSELAELLAMADRFIVLAEGRVADEFTKAQASEHRVMLAATQARSQVGAKSSSTITP